MAQKFGCNHIAVISIGFLFVTTFSNERVWYRYRYSNVTRKTLLISVSNGDRPTFLYPCNQCSGTGTATLCLSGTRTRTRMHDYRTVPFPEPDLDPDPNCAKYCIYCPDLEPEPESKLIQCRNWNNNKTLRFHNTPVAAAM
jgi:hypothetical protein